MKNRLTYLIVIIVLTVSIGTFTSFSSSYYSMILNEDVQFKVINDTQADFSYVVGGVQKTIPKGQSVGFSYPENTIIYKWTNGQQGEVWFTVKAEMKGRSYKLSELLNNQ